MPTEDSKVWVNTLIEKDLAEKLDEMVKENGSTRAQLIRLLIEQEHGRRQQVRKQMNKMRAKGLLPK